MADSSRDEHLGRDEITQLPDTPRPPSQGSAAPYRQRSAAGPTPAQRRPSIRIRRLPSTPTVQHLGDARSSNVSSEHEGERTGRRRASSAPMRPSLPPDLARQGTVTSHLPALTEESSAPQLYPNAPPPATDGHLAPPAAAAGRLRSGSTSRRLRRLGSNLSARLAPPPAAPPTQEDEYESEIVDMLDVVGACRCTLSFPN